MNQGDVIVCNGMRARVLCCCDGEVDAIALSPREVRGQAVTLKEGDCTIEKPATERWSETFGVDCIDPENMKAVFKKSSTTKSKPKRKGAKTLQQQLGAAIASGNIEEQKRLLEIINSSKKG